MDISLVTTTDREVFFQQLNLCIDERLPTANGSVLKQFAEQYFALYPIEELDGRQWNDVYGSTYAWWNFIQQLDPQQPKVRVFNPTLEEDGWLCEHTVITVAMRDIPFLVDSIRMVINRRNVVIHTIFSSHINVGRDDRHRLVDLLPDNGKTKAGKSKAAKSKNSHYGQETMMHFEINLHTSSEEMQALASAIESVLADVALAVDDYQPILAKANETVANLCLAADSINDNDKQESRAFVAWLVEGFFTFLGYSEYQFTEKDGRRYLCELPEQRLGLFKKHTRNYDPVEVDDFNVGMARFHLTPHMLTFSKSGSRARVHRPSYSDYVIVKKYDDSGKVCGECRYLGLYTSPVYNLSPKKIPLLRQKVAHVMAQSGMDAQSYDGKLLTQVLETFPRDELFQSNAVELYQTTAAVARINDRHMVRLFMRTDPYGKFVSCIVYVPRDIFSTRIRERIQDLIGAEINAEECEFNTYFSESILARAYLVFRVDAQQKLNYDVERLQAKIIDITRTWDDQLASALCEAHGEEQGTRLYRDYRRAFSTSYKENFEARLAVHDICSVGEMKKEGDLAMSFYQPMGSGENELRFKAFNFNGLLELSDVIPVLENLGLRVIGEHPYKIRLDGGNFVWMHDFSLVFGLPVSIDVQAAKKYFQEAFAAVWFGRASSDPFNRLVLGARLNWREITILRAYAHYMKQTMFNFSRVYIAQTLANHLEITRNLVALFKACFDPRINTGSDKDKERIERLNGKILEALDQVDNLNEDRIIRRYLDMINGTLRTNYFQALPDGSPKDYLSLKLSPRNIPDIPEPRPMYEIYVYSPQVEGVHLRGSKVARGGLRWSDRLQDYRTEVLGLVKAQQVKNAVIVPSGAKGGFVAKRPPTEGGRQAFLNNGIECYKTFIRGLLDVTDNLIDGELVPPEQVVRRDDDDPYLVVAADKGTATFSDIANGISTEYNHWLGDAFASGGSQGYDHKAMGITARGAWVSVQRHFKEKGLDVQQQDFTVIGVGDMGGDVFGNGMLLSEHIQLVSAFNHLHIFIDPNPDSAASFIERKRLFETPGLSWDDYDKALISKGGGVFKRSLKSIKLTPEMKQRFDISADKLTPNDLLHALLKAPVDMLWNGGIGTYVKASSESHAEVGDKANDCLRVDGGDLRCRVVGEGGNLGMTQRGRVEFCLNGGACNTDFIDNAAGVDCSDHEVNIKILLNEVVQNGDMTEKQRNKLLEQMTDTVAELVLSNNYRQTQAISLAENQGLQRLGEYRRFINDLEERDLLDRELEFLPSDEEISERQAQGQALTRPELSVLISYAKVVLKESLSKSNITDDDYVVKLVETAFPAEVRKRFKSEIYGHRLRKEIVATQLANDMVNIMGITFCQRLMESTGAKPEEVAKAYVAASDIYHLEGWWQEVEALDYQVPAELQMELMAMGAQRVKRASRWFLRNRRGYLNPSAEVAAFEGALHEGIRVLPTLLRGEQQEIYERRFEALKERGLPESLASRQALPATYSGLNMVEAAKQSEAGVARVVETYFCLGDKLGLYWFSGQIAAVRVESYWQAMAREAFMDDLESQMRTLVVSLLSLAGPEQPIDEVIGLWMDQHRVMIERWNLMMSELQGAPGTDYAMFSVALRELLDLAQSSQFCTSFDDQAEACVIGS